MTGTPDVSLIIVNWNTRQLLIDCIDSLKRETRQCAIEIIVVDNGSSDDSCEALRERFPGVTVVENEKNLGFARANNIGIAVAKGRYVFMVNSDIIALDECVDLIVEYLDTHHDVGALGPLTIDEHGALRRNCRRFPSLWTVLLDAMMLTRLPFVFGRALPDDSYQYTHDAEVISGCFFAVRRAVLEKVGVLDERFFLYGEDVDFCRRILEASYRVIFYPQARAIHYGGASSSAKPERFTVEMEKADLQYWHKHHAALSCLIYWVLRVVHHVLRVIVWVPTRLFYEDQGALKMRGAISCISFLFREVFRFWRTRKMKLHDHDDIMPFAENH